MSLYPSLKWNCTRMYFWSHCGFRQQWTAILYFLVFKKWNWIVPAPVIFPSDGGRTRTMGELTNQFLRSTSSTHSVLRHRRYSHLTVAMALPVCRRLSVKAAVFDKDIVCQDDSLFALASIAAECERESERERASGDVLLYQRVFFYLFIFIFFPFSLYLPNLSRGASIWKFNTKANKGGISRRSGLQSFVHLFHTIVCFYSIS